MPIDEILASPLLPAEIISDNHLIWGVAEIVGSKKLDAEDIDFPMHAGYLLSAKKEKRFIFCWGLGMFASDPSNDIPIIYDSQSLYINHLYNNGVSIEIDPYPIIREFRGESPRNSWNDICHPKNIGYKNAVFRYLDMSDETTLDEFNVKHNGMTRQEYANYANKYLRKI